MSYTSDYQKSAIALNRINVIEKSIPILGRFTLSLLNCKSKEEAQMIIDHSTRFGVPLPNRLKTLTESIDFEKLAAKPEVIIPGDQDDSDK